MKENVSYSKSLNKHFIYSKTVKTRQSLSLTQTRLQDLERVKTLNCAPIYNLNKHYDFGVSYLYILIETCVVIDAPRNTPLGLVYINFMVKSQF